MKFKKFLVLIAIIIGTNYVYSAVYCRIQPEKERPDSVYFVGDTVRFEVNIENSSNVKFTGIRVYLTINPKYLKPILHDGRPFIDAQFIETPPKDNNTHGDVWGSPMANGIPGFQLDYYQSTGPRNNAGYRPRVSGSGTVAYLDLVCIGIPQDKDDYFMRFDNSNYYKRKSGYYELGDPGNTIPYSNTIVPYFNIVGASIQPNLPDTVLIPGKSISKYLGDHFYCKAYDDEDAIWDYEILKNEPSGIFNIDTTDDKDILSYQTAPSAKGKLIVELGVNIEGTGFYDSQIWEVRVDYPPEFADPLPDVSFKEDESFTIAREELVTDQDDDSENLQIYKDTTDSDINLIYDTAGDSIKIIPRENWYGTKNMQIFADDGLVFTPVDTNLRIAVESVNDLPVIDFSGIDARGDTLVLYQMIDDTLDLKEYTSDVDNEIAQLEWNVNKLGSNSGKISSTFHNQDTLVFSVAEDGFYGSVPVEISVEDSYGATGKDTLIVDVRSFPPSFTNLPTIAMHSDSVKKVDLSQYMYDMDTPLENITIEPDVIYSQTELSNDSVEVTYNQTNQELTIDVPNQYDEYTFNGKLVLTAEDDDNNITNSQTDLIIVNVSPKIFNIPPAYVTPDTTADILDLSDYVFDIYESSSEINWSIENSQDFSLLQNATINDTMLQVTSGSKVGQDTIEVVATNSKGGSDSSEVVVVIAPEDPSPVIFELPNKTVFWKDSAKYVDLDDYVFDAISPDSALEWKVTGYDNSFLEVIIDEDSREVFLNTKDLTGNTSITFTATDEDGNSSSKDANIMIQKDSKPVWTLASDVKYIYMSFSQHQRELDFKLSDKCTDDLNNSKELIYNSLSSSEIQNINIDPLTTIPTVTLDTTIASNEGWIAFTAEDKQGNIGRSDTISVIIRETIPPIWAHLPSPIRMDNDETFTLDLFTYCNDPDNSNSDLDFSYKVYSNENLVTEGVRIDFSQDGEASISMENGFFGDVKLQLIATDPDSNKSSASTRLKISDQIPPDVTLEYFQNPISARRVNFIITSDYSNIREFETSFYKNGNYIPLTFDQMDSNQDHKIWKAEYKFDESTNYKLITSIEDRYYNEAIDTLSIAAELPKIAGGMVSLNNQLAVEYPEYNYDDNQFFMLTNHVQSKDNGKQLAKTTTRNKTYRFNTSIENGDISTIVYYSPDHDIDKYHSFYKVVKDKLIPVQTYINSDGKFMAFIEPDVEFLFKESDRPASVQKVTENSILTYPNPFNSTVNIKFMVKKKSNLQMNIYNILGQKVLSKKQTFSPGINSFTWNAQNSQGAKLSSGIYFIVLRKNTQKLKVKKVTYFK